MLGTNVSERGLALSGVATEAQNKREKECLVDIFDKITIIAGIVDYCNGFICVNKSRNYFHAEIPKTSSRDSWRPGRRIIELGYLLESLRYCSQCKLGPVPFTEVNVVCEIRKGFGGYLFVNENTECHFVNRVPYGKIHRVKKTGMPCFAASTKLGLGMLIKIDVIYLFC